MQIRKANKSLCRSNNPMETARYTAAVLFSRRIFNLSSSTKLPEFKASTMQLVKMSWKDGMQTKEGSGQLGKLLIIIILF